MDFARSVQEMKVYTVEEDLKLMQSLQNGSGDITITSFRDKIEIAKYMKGFEVERITLNMQEWEIFRISLKTIAPPSLLCLAKLAIFRALGSSIFKDVDIELPIPEILIEELENDIVKFYTE